MSLNPITSIIETFKYATLGVGSYSPYALLYSAIFTVLILCTGILVFNRIQKRLWIRYKKSPFGLS
jgi:lipopolysaccharide transport system permease protein